MKREMKYFEIVCVGNTECASYDDEVEQAWWDHVHESELTERIVGHLEACSHGVKVTALQ